jgi:hypothetical protein
MATPFDHLPKFQALPDDVKAKILDKFNQKPEEEKMQIMGKIGTPMSAQDADPGLKPIEPVTDTLKKGLESYKENAPTLEEGLVGSGINPSLAKVASTVFAHIPDIASLAGSGLPVNRVKTVAGVTESLASPVIKGSKSALNAAKAGYITVANAIKGTGEKEAMALSEKLAELPLKQTAKQELAIQTKKAAQKGIQVAEQKAGIGLNSVSSEEISATLKNPASFADKMERITSKGVEGLDNASPKVLSSYRETIKAAIADKNLPQGVKVKLMQSQKVLNDAIAKNVPEVGKEMGKFKEIQQVLDNLGPQFKKEKQLLQLALKKAQNLSKTQQGIVKGAKTVALGGAAGAGAYIARKALQ